MPNTSWLLYGAYGYTGNLIAKHAKDRGHEPVLAGRSKEKLVPLAEKLDLDYEIFNLNDEDKILKVMKDFDLVFHAAGPYKYTSDPMVKACLKSKTNYLDITGEIPVMEQNFRYDARAKRDEFAIISGVGFDVVPTDCLAKYLSKKLEHPTSLEIAVNSTSRLSPGTLKTMLEYDDMGKLVRKNGKLAPLDEDHTRKVKFIDQELTVRPTTWGDLSTAYRTTGIPNITVYFPIPKETLNFFKLAGISVREKNSKEEARKKVQKWIDENIQGPDESMRKTNRCQIWASVSDDEGNKEQAWLATMESYRFTAVASVLSLEKVFELRPKGALTPALAFGADFVLDIPETIRYDSLTV